MIEPKIAMFEISWPQLIAGILATIATIWFLYLVYKGIRWLFTRGHRTASTAPPAPTPPPGTPPATPPPTTPPTPAQPPYQPPSDWGAIGRTFVTICVIGVIAVFFWVAREPFGRALDYGVDRVGRWSKSDSPPARTAQAPLPSAKSGPANPQNPSAPKRSEDEEIAGTDPAELKREIERLQTSLEDVWQIPKAESWALLEKSGGVPGSTFWKLMSDTYLFKRLPGWRWNTLPSSIEDVPETYFDQASGRFVPYTYTLQVDVFKSKASRKIKVTGWEDEIRPADGDKLGNVAQTLDRGKATELKVLFWNSNYYVYFQNGTRVRQEVDWYPVPKESYDLKLPTDHIGSEPVRFIIKRTRRKVEPSDQAPPLRTQ